MRRGRGVAGALAVGAVGAVAVLALAGCGEDTRAGFGTPHQLSPSQFPGERVDVRGTVVLRGNGCRDLDLGDGDVRWIVWPTTAAEANDGADVRIGDRVVAPGDLVVGSGTLIGPDAVAGWDEAGLPFGPFAQYCGADAKGAVVLDDAAVSGS